MKDFTFLLLLCFAARGALGGVPPTEPPDLPEWDNEFNGTLNVECPCGYGLGRVRSEFSTDCLDRQWDWDCVKITDSLVREKCQWYTANEEEKTMIFRCPKRQYMAGIRSNYFEDTNDRVWEVRCCNKVGRICPRGCTLSSCISPDDFDYCASEGHVFVGLVSDFNATQSDRVWRIEQCEVKKCQLYAGIDIKKRKTDESEEEYEEKEEKEEEEEADSNPQ